MSAAEHGQSGDDEVNRIGKGCDFGWPAVQGDQAREGMRRPRVHSGRPTRASSGLGWVRGRPPAAGIRAEGLIAVTPEGRAETRRRLGARTRDLVELGGAIFAITTEGSPRRDGPGADRLIRVAP